MTDCEVSLSDVVKKYQMVIERNVRELEEFRSKAEAHERHLIDLIERDRRFVALLQKEVEERANVCGPSVETIESKPSAIPKGVSRSLRKERLGMSPTKLIRQLAKEILESEGGVLSRTEIRKRIEARGIHIESPNLPSLIATALNRSPMFVHVKGSGYSLAVG